MKSVSKFGFALVLASTGLAVSEARADCLADLSAAPPTAPVNCSVGRNLAGYRAGVWQGMSLVDQIWESDAIDEDVAQWPLFSSTVTATLPTIVTTFLTTLGLSDYVKCRAQGIIDAAPCQMMSHNPAVPCALDGEAWGYISGKLYCDLSIAFGGLGDPGSWSSQPANICSENFEVTCPITYNYVSTSISALPAPPSPLTAWGLIPSPVAPIAACHDYTIDSGVGNFATLYAASRQFDCTYAY